MTEQLSTTQPFKELSEAFGTYRPEYPKAVYDWIAKQLSQEQRGTAVDVACGTGKSTGGLTSIFRNTFGLDLELNQVRKATELYPDTQFLVSRAEICPFKDHTVDVVTVATAFYWFHMAKSLEEFRRLLKSGGHFFVYKYKYPIPENKRILAIQRREYEEHWRLHKDPRLSLDNDSGEVLKRSCMFRRISYRKFPNLVPMNAAQMAGFWSSTSYGAAYARNLRESVRYWKALEKEFDAVLSGKTVDMDFAIHAWHGQLIA